MAEYAEYIGREALKERFTKRLDWLRRDIHDEYSGALYDSCETDMELIDEIPAANVAPAVHGKWERVANPNWPAHTHDKCNICGWWNTRSALCYDGRKGHSLNYCPNCGAKMDGGVE